MSSTTVLGPARQRVQGARACSRPKSAPRLTAVDRLGFALAEARDAAAALLDGHGGGCECCHCENARAALFNLNVHLSLVESECSPEEAPAFFYREGA